MIIACDARGDAYLASRGLDLGLLLAHRPEGWAIVCVAEESLLVRFAYTPEDAAGLVAEWMRFEDGVNAGFVLEAAVLDCLKARQARGLH